MVGDLEQKLAVSHGYFDVDNAAGVAEFDGIAKQVDNHLTHTFDIHLYLRQLRGDYLIKGDILLSREAMKHLSRIGEDIR
jgi:hypothetical protein